MRSNVQIPVLLVGTAETCPDIVYATGFVALDPVALLLKGGRTWLAVPVLEAGRAKRALAEHGARTGARVVTPQELKGRGSRPRGADVWALRLTRLAGVRRVRVPAGFPYNAARLLIKNGVRVAAVEEVFPERSVKMTCEVDRIRESQQAAVLAMRAATSLVGRAATDACGRLKLNGSILTSEALQTAVQKCLLDHGCSCPEVIAAGGAQGADPHEKGSGPLRAGEPIVIDIFPRHKDHRYCGDLTRTVLKGKAPARVLKMYRAVRAAQKAALSQIRPGVKGATVHNAAQREIERRGFRRCTMEGKACGFIHGTGHGVGLCVHEAPSLSTVPGRLRSGHVVTVEPGLYYPDVGGVRIEDTVLVTKTGWRYLVPCEKRLEL